MALRWAGVAWGLVLVGAGCGAGQSSSSAITGIGAAATSLSPESDGGGACFREGASYCEADDECACMIATFESLTEPRPAPSTFNANRCVELDVCAGRAPIVTCRCFDDENGRGGTLLDGHGDGCLWGGGPRGCHYTAEEFAGCDLANASSCDATCAVINAREAEEAMHVYAVERRGIRCNDGVCEGVVAIDGQCYVTEDLAHAYDCAQGDAEIFAQYDARGLEPEPDPCTGGATDG